MAELSLPRRRAIAELVGEICRAERALASRYAAFSAASEPAPLRTGLGEIAEARRRRLPAVEAVRRALGEGAVGTDEPTVEDAPRSQPWAGRAERFTEVFEGERDLDALYRQVLDLLGDPAACPGLPDLVGEGRTLRSRLRDLYLRYS